MFRHLFRLRTVLTGVVVALAFVVVSASASSALAHGPCSGGYRRPSYGYGGRGYGGGVYGYRAPGYGSYFNNTYHFRSGTMSQGFYFNR